MRRGHLPDLHSFTGQDMVTGNCAARVCSSSPSPKGAERLCINGAIQGWLRSLAHINSATNVPYFRGTPSPDTRRVATRTKLPIAFVAGACSVARLHYLHVRRSQPGLQDCSTLLLLAVGDRFTASNEDVEAELGKSRLSRRRSFLAYVVLRWLKSSLRKRVSDAVAE